MKNYPIPKGIKGIKFLLILKAVEYGCANTHIIAKRMESKGVKIDRSRTLKKYLDELEKLDYIWQPHVVIKRPVKKKRIDRGQEIYLVRKMIRIPGRGLEIGKLTKRDFKGYMLTYKGKMLLETKRVKNSFPGKNVKFVWPK